MFHFKTKSQKYRNRPNNLVTFHNIEVMIDFKSKILSQMTNRELGPGIPQSAALRYPV